MADRVVSDRRAGGPNGPLHGLLLTDFDESVTHSGATQEANMAAKQTTPPISTLASKVLSGDIKPTAAQVKSLAASALSQDQTKGQKPRGR